LTSLPLRLKFHRLSQALALFRKLLVQAIARAAALLTVDVGAPRAEDDEDERLGRPRQKELPACHGHLP
jgi:hypothetical protein